jgi:hypothetical protein
MSCERVALKTLALRRLAWKEKRLDQLALAAHGHAAEALAPCLLGNLGLCVKPPGKQFQLQRRNFPALNPVQQMLRERWRQVLTPDLRRVR